MAAAIPCLKVGVHQRFVLRFPVLFIIVLEALPKEFKLKVCLWNYFRCRRSRFEDIVTGKFEEIEKSMFKQRVVSP